MSPTIFPFTTPTEEEDFRIFPSDIEDDELVVYHGTAKSNVASILATGFRRNPEAESVSFAQKSFFALNYAAGKRTADSPEGAILACRLRALGEPGVVVAGGLVHVYFDHLIPPIVGICIVPATYLHH